MNKVHAVITLVIPFFLATLVQSSQTSSASSSSALSSSSTSTSALGTQESKRTFAKKETEDTISLKKIYDYLAKTKMKDLQKAAEQNNADAQYFLAICYYWNKLITTNLNQKERFAEAVRLLTLAAEQKHAPARYTLAMCYYNNEGVPANLTENQRLAQAVRLLTLASEQGYIEAQCRLAYCYLNGTRTQQDIIHALELFATVAENNDRDESVIMAQLMLYKILNEGIYLPKDEDEAQEYYKKIQKVLGSEKAAKDFSDNNHPEDVFRQPGVLIDRAGQKCPICYAKFTRDASVLVLSCWHCVCQTCLQQWINAQILGRCTPSCPICRALLTNPKTAVTPGIIGSLAENESSSVTEQQVAQQSASSSSSSSQKAESKESKA